MSYPDPGADLRQEVAFDGATWVDVTPNLPHQAVAITNYGRQNEMTEPQPLEVSFVLRNESGDYTPGKVDGAHFPNVTLGVPTRTRIGASQAGMYVRHPDLVGEMWAQTPHHASLSPAGDAEWRIEVLPSSWRPTNTTILGAKHTTSGTGRSWVMRLLSDGRIGMVVSFDGTTNITGNSTGAIPDDGQRRFLRWTFDADNGGGFRVLNHSYGPTIDGPWTSLGNTFFGGTGGLFASTTTLTLGAGVGGGNVFSDNRAYDGWIYRFQHRDGIGGTIVADPDFTAQPPGSDPFTDSAGRTWTLFDGSRIFDPSIRAYAEVAQWQPSWPEGDMSDEFGDPGIAQVDVVAAGLLRRLGNDDSPVDDSIHRFTVDQPAAVKVGYWPMSDPDGSTSVAAVVGKPMRPATVLGVRGLPRFGGELAPYLPDGAETQTAGGAIRGSCVGGKTGGFAADFLYRAGLPSGGSTETPISFVLEVAAGRAVYDVQISPATGLTILVFDDAGGSIVSSSTGLGALHDGQLHYIRLRVINDVGTSQGVFVDVDEVNQLAVLANTGESVPGVPGSVALAWDGTSAQTLPVQFGQLTVWNEPVPGLFDVGFAYTGNAGEPAGTRMERLGREEGIRVKVLGDPLQTARMGPQYSGTFLELIQQCAAVDGGMLYESHDSPELLYRPMRHQVNQPVLVLDADSDAGGDITNPFVPVLDDEGVVNDLTVRSPAGGQVQGAVDVGPKSTQDPPAGAGRKKREAEFNPESDDSLPNLLSWMLHLGTWPGMRYPAVSPALNTVPGLWETWARVSLGDRLQVTNLPPQHPNETVDLVVQGWVETIRTTGWTVEVNCSPAGPYTVGVANDQILGRVDTDGSELAVPVETGTDTTMQVTTADGPVWTTDSAEYPDGFDVVLTESGHEGVKLHVTAISSPAADTFTRSLSDDWGSPNSGPATPAGLLLPGSVGDYASTPHAAVLNIAGDIDVRVDATATDWTPSSTQYLLSKFATTGDQRSWRLLVQTSGVISFGWSVDGAADILRSSTVAPTIPGTGRLVVRATLDADNGAGGHTVRFYTGPTVNGPWTQLGSDVTNAGTTSIFEGSAPVEAGSVAGGILPFAGRIHAARVYDGVEGTIVANPAFAAQPPATTTFTDSAGRVWAVNGSASIAAAGSVLPWTLNGTVANFDVDGTAGTIVGTLLGQFATLGSYADVELLARMSRTTNNGELAVMARWVDIDNRYSFEMDFDSGSHDLSIWRTVGGIPTRIAGPLDMDFALDPTLYWMRVRLVGSLLQMRVWPDGTSEPPIWHLSVTDTSHASGAVGLGNFNATGLGKFQDFTVTSPQTFTFDQPPANGVTKTVPAASGVRLANPARVGL